MSSSSSSATATATAAETAGGEETALMYWCHECDISIHLLLPSPTTAGTPTCPHCHLGFLELIDITTSSSSAASVDFLHLDSPTFFSKQPTDDDHDEGNPDDRSFLSYFLLLPTVRIGEEEGSLPCAVCREQFGVEEDAKRLPCGHLFHGECILPWLSSGHLSCPLCRFQLLTNPPRVEDDDDDEGRWFILLQSCMASSSSSSYYAGSHDGDASQMPP